MAIGNDNSAGGLFARLAFSQIDWCLFFTLACPQERLNGFPKKPIDGAEHGNVAHQVTESTASKCSWRHSPTFRFRILVSWISRGTV